jgi:hypothetical protein
VPPSRLLKSMSLNDEVPGKRDQVNWDISAVLVGESLHKCSQHSNHPPLSRDPRPPPGAQQYCLRGEGKCP